MSAKNYRRSSWHRKTHITVFVWIAPLLLVATSCQSSPQENRKEQGSTERTTAEAKREKEARNSPEDSFAEEKGAIEERIKETPALADLIRKHDAVTLWESELQRSGQWYAISLQEALIRQDHRPTLLFVFLADISKKGDTYFLDFELQSKIVGVHFVLEAQVDDVRALRQQSPSLYDEYAVIATVTSVAKPRFAVTANPTADEDAEIELSAPYKSLAYGRCLALQRLPNNSK